MIKPTYIIDSKKLFSTYCKYSEKANVFFPVKCNDNMSLLSLLKTYGSGFEIETDEHLRVAIKLGINPKKILFYSPFLFKEDIRLAVDYGIRFFVVDTIEVLTLLDSFNIKYSFLIRIKVDREISDSPKRFGADEEQTIDLIRSSKNGTFLGFSFYLNAECNSLENRRKVIEQLLYLGVQETKIINVGGGVPVSEIDKTIQLVNNKYNVIFEPGRFLLNPCILLKGSVIEKKIIDDKQVLFLNIGIYNGLLDVIIKNKRFEVESTTINQKYDEFILSGPTGDCSDIIGTYSLPSKIDVGDDIIFKDCGAYSEVLCTNFYRYNNMELIIK